MDPYTLLIIARNQSSAERLRSALSADQYLVRWVPSVVQAVRSDLQPSLLVLELPPSGGARSVARLKRHFSVPLLAISRSDQPIPSGVDTFLPRGCSVEELVERTESTLMTHSPHIVRAGGMSLDTRARRLQVNGLLFQIRPIGSRILAILMARAGQIVTRDELFQRVWRVDDGDNTRALDVHIAYLRRVLESDPHYPRLIRTERGLGYRLQPPD
jgi:DNA-binding response OmpR family regulator